ncbi:MAG: molybdopterin molybdotransferase MoeA [Anaerolineae bacterium]|nr:molybdopterin molybdotransferase MoeA [Anaerolineae bacterium]
MTERSDYPVLSVEEARERILSFCHPLAPASRPILDALDLVLAEDVAADRDTPPADNSAMDGYAVYAADLDPAGGTRLPVVMDIAAGHPPARPLQRGEAARIMTGALMPEGPDTVVQFEHTEGDGRMVTVRRSPSPGRNVRRRGEDVRAGEVVLRRGKRLRPQEIGMLASVGRSEVLVQPPPLVGLLATGDEVVPLGEAPEPGQIRDINTYTNAAQVRRAGGKPLLAGVAHDDAGEIGKCLRAALDAGASLIVTSGGVSVGDFDLVKQVLSAQGEMGFWLVNMKPGKPLAFGTVAGVPLIGLPGNPVSAMIAFELFARPAVHRLRGLPVSAPRTIPARLSAAIERKDGRRHYLRVQLRQDDGLTYADLTGDQGSGILTSLVEADGLAIVPEDIHRLPAGAEVQVVLLE